MSHFAPLPLQAVNITHVGDEAAITIQSRIDSTPMERAR
jgi:hypothetical protein